MSASSFRFASRFPLVLLCGLAGAVAGIAGAAKQWMGETPHRYLEIEMTVALGMPLFFSLHLLSERSKRWVRLAVPLSGIPLLAAYYLWLIPASSDWTPVHLLPFTFQIYYEFKFPSSVGWPMLVPVSWGLAFAGLHFFAAAAAYPRGSQGGGFWQFNWRVFVQFWRATLYSGVLLAVLELMLLTADQVFGWQLQKGYIYLYFIVAGCFQPACFLSGVPRDFDALAVDSEYPRGLRVFVLFALVPLVAVFTALAYACAIKIILTRAWPEGFVAMPVLITAGIGIPCALLLHPLRPRWFCTIFPWALGPLSLLLLLSVRERIIAYGVTEYRYLGLVSGCWIAAWSLVYIIRKDARIRWVPASLAVMCLTAVLGPWSAATISRNSQYSRLTKLFRARRLMIGDEFHAPREQLELPADEAANIRSAIQYLVSMHGAESMHRLFSGILSKADWPNLTDEQALQQIWFKLNLKSALRYEMSLQYVLKDSEAVNIEGFRRATYGRWFFNGMETHGAISVHDGTLWMKTPGDGGEEAVPLDTFLKSLPSADGPLSSGQLTVNWTQGDHMYRILFTHLEVQREAGESPHIESASCMLYEQ